jgi:hypothetical protein
MVRMNLLPGWRKDVRQTEMARELCQYAVMFLGMTVIFAAYVVMCMLR